jgi:eukaryotic-like serine/threonine-protein kinase
MKIPRFPLIFTISLLFGLLLSACSGAMPINTWPGLSAGENTVYLAYQTAVFAIDANNGNLTWRFPADAKGGSSVFAPPVVADSQVVVGSYGNALYGLNPTSGAQNWVFPSTTSGSQNGVYPKEGSHFVASPLVINDTILAPSSDYNLYALDSRGNYRWRFKTGNVLWGQPASNGELVFLPAMDHNLYALRLLDGSKVWSADLGGSLMNTPVLQDNTLFVSTIGGLVAALDARDGKVLWSQDIGEKVWSPLVYHEDKLYFGTSDGNVYSLSTNTNVDAASRVLWKVAVDGPVVGAGAVTQNGLVFTTETGAIQSLRFTGEKLWSQKVNGKLYTTPVVINDTLIVAATDGDALLTAYNLDGGQKWIFSVPK